jgi:membrane associated rhomboid family serine protease
MAELVELVVYTLIGVTILISWQGFRNSFYFEKYLFEVDKILIDKQYYRLFTSAFLHGGWWHLAFNMITLYSFGIVVGDVLGIDDFLIIYFGSKLLGSLLALYIHRNHGDYRSIGASGAISGVLFSFVSMFPTMQINVFMIPGLNVYAWLYGLAFILISIYGIKRSADNIGHEAHLGGALGGVLITILLNPVIIIQNYMTILAITLPAALFLTLIVYKPAVLWIPNYWGIDRKQTAPAIAKNYDVLDDETALNELLEKVSEKGYHNLTKQEKKKLEELSKKIDINN